MPLGAISSVALTGRRETKTIHEMDALIRVTSCDFADRCAASFAASHFFSKPTKELEARTPNLNREQKIAAKALLRIKPRLRAHETGFHCQPLDIMKVVFV